MKKLTLIDRAFLLKSTPLFAALDLDTLLPIADKLSQLTCDAKDVIFDIDDQAQRMYLVVKGEIELRDENRGVLANLTTADFFGDEALFNDQPRAYQAICKTNAVILSLSRTNLFTIISECPTVAIALLQVYTSTSPCRPWNTGKRN